MKGRKDTLNMERILALVELARQAADALADWVVQGFDKGDYKVIVTVLGAVVLAGGLLWISLREETVVVHQIAVSEEDTAEAVRRMKSAGGILEQDANGEVAAITLTDRAISDSGWELVGRLYNLRKLVLHNCKVDESRLSNLAALGELRVLSLSHSSVTDASVDHIAMLSNLRALDLQGTKVSRKGISRLRASLPDCNIAN